MKILFYMGRNDRNKSGVSWKIWKIQRSGRTLTTWWGPAGIQGRTVVPKSRLQEKENQFSSIEEAKAQENLRIEAKLRKGYERRPRRG